MISLTLHFAENEDDDDLESSLIKDMVGKLFFWTSVMIHLSTVVHRNYLERFHLMS